MRKLLLFTLLCCTVTQAAETAPPLMLANVYHSNISISQYLVSEKLDGVRAYWDGTQLLTRSGEPIHTPDWFTQNWPNTPLDGELWIARGQFELTSAIVRSQHADDAQWRKISYMLFDLPSHTGTFTQRHQALTTLVQQTQQPWFKQVAQFSVPNHAALRELLNQIDQQGGEGLMLHRSDSMYAATRNDNLLKFKLYQDNEAKVIGYIAGKGKYAGQLGALLVETPQGLRFRLGSGLSDALRAQPPALGTWITYRYNGVHEKSGTPRFARFMRIRTDRQ